MSALPWVKYDQGPMANNGSLSDLPSNCFPVRNLLRSSSASRKFQSIPIQKLIFNFRTMGCGIT
jgi:hypothetical protein